MSTYVTKWNLLPYTSVRKNNVNKRSASQSL